MIASQRPWGQSSRAVERECEVEWRGDPQTGDALQPGAKSMDDDVVDVACRWANDSSGSDNKRRTTMGVVVISDGFRSTIWGGGQAGHGSAFH